VIGGGSLVKYYRGEVPKVFGPKNEERVVSKLILNEENENFGRRGTLQGEEGTQFKKRF